MSLAHRPCSLPLCDGAGEESRRVRRAGVPCGSPRYATPPDRSAVEDPQLGHAHVVLTNLDDPDLQAILLRHAWVIIEPQGLR
jgi:hypothetical protein